MYKYAEIKGGRKLSEITESEQAYIRSKWETLCNRPAINNSERVFFQKSNGRFFEATRGRIAAFRGQGSAGGYWAIRYGDCTRWGFKKNVCGMYDPEPMDWFFNALTTAEGETISIPRKVHTKKEVLELARKLRFID